MRTTAYVLPALVLATTLRAARADGGSSSLLHARRAQQLLGPHTWSRVLQIVNRSTSSRYPRHLDALVFELAGALWFYTDSEGTQSLSREIGDAAGDKQNLAPLLRRIEPGFVTWTDAAPATAPIEESGPLPNGCFIEAIALLRRRLASGAITMDPRLLSYYVNLPTGERGHTVLQFRTPAGWIIIDPLHPHRLQRVPTPRTTTALAFALELRTDVARAVTLPLPSVAPANGAIPSAVAAASHTTHRSSPRSADPRSEGMAPVAAQPASSPTRSAGLIDSLPMPHQDGLRIWNPIHGNMTACSSRCT